jgi:SAM-dependent methyltransferase
MSTAALDTIPPTSHSPRLIELTVLNALGVELPKTAKILDFGCGAGRTIRAFRALGYANTHGYDVGDGRSLLGMERENVSVGSLLDLKLPYEERVFQELWRITKPGGHGLHVIPARYMPIEGHIFVPFGGVIQHRWWYKLWALLGIRNKHQIGLTPDEVADHNAFFVTDATRYVATSCYRVMWKQIGFQYRFAEQEFFDTHTRASMRAIGRLGWPAMCLYRTFRSRVVHLYKPA